MRKIEVSSAASALASVLNSKRKTKKKERKKEIYYKNRPQKRLNLNQCYVLVGWAGGSVIIMQRSYWRARFALCFRLAIFSARLNTQQKKEGKNGGSVGKLRRLIVEIIEWLTKLAFCIHRIFVCFFVFILTSNGKLFGD